MSEELIFNVAETFYSLKGEGFHTGTPMYFLRLAGCNVGRKNKGACLSGIVPGSSTRTGSEAEICTSWDGLKFLCDTDFNCHEKMTVHAVLRDMESKAGKGIKWCVITGGEPMMLHNIPALQELNRKLLDMNVTMHIETNGCYPIPVFVKYPYVACSPKQGYLPTTITRADELRLLMDQHTQACIPDIFLRHPRVFVSPINPATGFDDESSRACMEILKDHPNWRYNAQLHKYLNIL